MKMLKFCAIRLRVPASLRADSLPAGALWPVIDREIRKARGSRS